MPVRGIRGAINVSANTRDAIQEATRRLLVAMCEANRLDALARALSRPTVGVLERQLAGGQPQMRSTGRGRR